MRDLKAAVYEAIGEASMCWEKPEGAGEFDSVAADRVAATLLGEIQSDGNLLYHYNAEVIKIVDADTIDVNIDVGFGGSRIERLRLARINAPEVRGPEREAGLEAKDWLEDIIPLHSRVRIRTYKDDSFGRYIAEVWLSGWQNINDMLVEAGHAVYKDYD